ncbi:hypothetical protein NQ317_016673 [Molorchus minor]|uniref:DBF4-type domain-containing protein n=1 Tax=Molorchus minor TaxID=1323400 RepID=A0ABQ9JPM6_9CUCU|nr:hypothetical protein NQ317_016673 [Molorchus minor]
MLERTTKPNFEGIVSKEFNYLEEQDLITLENRRTLRTTLRQGGHWIPAIQSGYCAVCSVPYNNVEDHIQSKKHLKLIGEDANYIALNGSLNGFFHTNSIPYLNLNGIDAIGVHETSLEEFSPRYRRKNMPRTRAASVMCDRVIKSSPLSPTGSDATGHHLRSRRNINYMTPPLDDDSLQEKPDLSVSEKQEVEPPQREYKEYRELRSSTRALAVSLRSRKLSDAPKPIRNVPVRKLTEQISNHEDEVWNSGRPKRTCIRQKHVSANESLVTNSKTYYKVEVLSSKLRFSSHQVRERDNKEQASQSPKRDEKDKGLIKDEASSEDEDVVSNERNIRASSVGQDERLSDTEEAVDISQTFKVEDEVSMDSTCSESKRKKRRRTHAEAFIMDNQKYYKFETPGSRLRYQGTYLPSGIKSPKHNSDSPLKIEEKSSEREDVLENISQMNEVPLDPKTCVHHYNELLRCICQPQSETESTGCCNTPEPSTASAPSPYQPELDEDSKMSAATLSSSCSFDEAYKRRRQKKESTKEGPSSSSQNVIKKKLTPQRVQRQPRTPFGRFKPKIDYYSIAKQIDDELDTALDDDIEELDITSEETVDFSNSKINVTDILQLYEESKSKEDDKTCRRFFREKPERAMKKDKDKESDNDNDDSTIDSVSVNMDSDDDDSNSNLTVVSVNKVKNSERKIDCVSNNTNCDGHLDKVGTLPEKVLTDKVGIVTPLKEQADGQGELKVHQNRQECYVGLEVGGTGRDRNAL